MELISNDGFYIGPYFIILYLIVQIRRYLIILSLILQIRRYLLILFVIVQIRRKEQLAQARVRIAAESRSHEGYNG